MNFIVLGCGRVGAELCSVFGKPRANSRSILEDELNRAIQVSAKGALT